jgi:hypothetical protein
MAGPARVTQPASGAAGGATRLLSQFTRSTSDDVVEKGAACGPVVQVTAVAISVTRAARQRERLRQLVVREEVGGPGPLDPAADLLGVLARARVFVAAGGYYSFVEAGRWRQ